MKLAKQDQDSLSTHQPFKVNGFVFFIVIGLIAFVVSIGMQPNLIPMKTLTVHDISASSVNTMTVGDNCYAEKCLIVYVAPWCPICHKVSPTIKSLVKQLEAEGVSATVIVGKDRASAVTAYADTFPFPVLLDANGGFYNSANLKGVPYYAVINSNAEIVNDFYGGYSTVNQFRDKLKI